MAVNLTGVLSDLTSAIPSSTDVLQQVLVGAGASVVLAGLKTNAGMDAVDPLHIIHHPDGNVSTISGKTLPASALKDMSADQIKAIAASGYSFV